MSTISKEKIITKIYDSYKNIDFTNRYESIYLNYNYDLKSLMTRMNKKDNLNVLKMLGYNFKISSPGQYYHHEETYKDIKLILSCQISKGMVFPFIYVYFKDEKIDKPYNAKISFVYKHLMNLSRLEPLSSLKFRNLDDLKNIMSDILEIYEDFKNEFLIQMKESK